MKLPRTKLYTSLREILDMIRLGFV